MDVYKETNTRLTIEQTVLRGVRELPHSDFKIEK